MNAIYDLLIIGGGINGTAIARDASGRGLKVGLLEQADIAGATSSLSSKMIHGGLRYLEHYEFRLVAEALAEREVMLKIAPHLTRPLTIVMPQVENLRPAWMIRLGLLLYDNLGRLRPDAPQTTLASSRTLSLRNSIYGQALQARYARAHSYSDVLDDDARLTLATARSAALLGADIHVRTQCVHARRQDGLWQVDAQRPPGRTSVQFRARALVNAAGPWVAEVLHGPLADAISSSPPATVQLIRGSHIVLPKQYEGDHGYLLQNDDGRVVFMLPFENEFTLIGTTEVKVEQPSAAQASPEEIDYLCRAAGRFLRHAPTAAQVVWHYSGLRPLFDDGHQQAGDVTRDYVFQLDAAADNPPLLSVFGGKLTTHRRLAAAALQRLQPWFPALGPEWTASRPLPGGDFRDFQLLHADLVRDYPELPAAWLRQLARRHGSHSRDVLGPSCPLPLLGRNFGGGLYQREVEYFIRHEWACTVEDILWRRSKCGLHMSPAERDQFGQWFAGNHHELMEINS